ncbi:MAG: hypothetical protein SVR08_18725 [Spirochaetota bacterium]|nr:hypothetical protein [Spirochaetota bacterium]
MITDNDGSCRDINFTGVKWMSVEAFINKLFDSYSSVKIQLTHSGKETTEVEFRDFIDDIKKNDTSANIYAEDTNNTIQQLQMYIFTDSNGQPFIELTFFPQDLNLSAERIDEFLSLIEEWKDILEATKFFVRYENMSWKLGDTSKYSGVIYTSNMNIA